MDRVPARRLFIVPILAISSMGCSRVYNRPAFNPAGRSTPVQVDMRDEIRVRAPFVDVRVPRQPKQTEPGFRMIGD